MGNERRERILALLKQKGEVQLQGLKEIFTEVSEMTLRRDLINLEEKGHAVRTYGGAVSTNKLAAITGEEDAYSRRASENVGAKTIIGGLAAQYLDKSRSVYLDAGSTVMCLARLITDESFTIVTSGVNIALEILKKPKVSIVALGGLVNRNTLSMSGPSAISHLDTINIDLAFMAASGFSAATGFTVSNVYEGELKRKLVKRARKVIMMVDSSKIDRDLPFTYAKLEDIDMWVCEKRLPENIMKKAENNNVEVVYE